MYDKCEVKPKDNGEIKVVKLERASGTFQNDQGANIPWQNYKIHFTIGDNPLIIQAKVDRLFGQYVDDMVEATTGFWEAEA